MQEQTVKRPKTTDRLIVTPGKGPRAIFVPSDSPHAPSILAASHEEVAISRSPHQRGFLTTQQGPDAIQVDKGLFRWPWTVSVSVCGVALPLLRRRGKAHGFHSFGPPNFFSTPSALSLAETQQALIFDNSRNFSSLAGLWLTSRSPMV